MDNDNSRGRGGDGRGRGRGPRSSSSSSSRITMMNTSTSSAPTRGRRGRGSRGGRGGRGRGKFNKSYRGQSYIDEEDEICQQALGQYELETSEISKALEKSEEASQLEGFDETAGEVWIYPTNKPIRDYQFEMVETALFHNTLVSLPTGLGKTFIAAVVMYNFQRWYPQGLIIFMAPTKPLVTQQMEACHNLVGIHPSKTIELTGQISPKKREELWKTKTVFFLTPQVMTSDLGRGVCPADKVKCIVVDEAHKALGQHAYAQAIQILLQTNTLFRVLALSATPGSDLIAVQQVFKNLLISRVELRSETSPDVLPYVHNRNVEPIVVPLDNYLNSIYQTVLEYLQGYTGKLLKNKALYGNDGYCFTQFQLVRSRATFREKFAQTVPNYLKGYIESDFATAISLSHSVDLLTSHGLRSFYIFLQGVLNKEKGNGQVVYELKKNTRLQDLLDEIKEKLNISPNSSLNGSSFFKTMSKNESNTCETTDDPENYLISHPKMAVLKDIVLSHFKKFESRNETTRIMIFSQYRDSVQEIGLMLNGLGPLVKPMVFIGQANTGTGGKGLKQKDQVQVVSQFRDGGYNILVATCVGEEGLDIGEVDLIICFDASKSPTRLVQRMGRTGRQRQGKIVFLLTEGKEEKNYNASLSLQSSISKNITDPKKLYPFLYKHSPRMVPRGVDPQCFKMEIVLTSEQDNQMVSNHCNQDEDFVEIDEYPPDSPVNIKPKSNPTKKSLHPPKKKQKLPTPQSSSNAYPDSKTLTLTQCFNDLFKKAKPSPPRLANPADTITTTTMTIPSPETINDVVIIEEEDGLIPHHHQQYEPIDSSILFDIFDLLDPSEMSSKPCLHIPTPPQSEFEWLPEYNEMDPDSILIPEYEMDFVVQKMESFRSIMFYLDECECGNINIDGVGRKMIINNNDSPSYSPLSTQMDDLQDEGLVENEEVDPFFNDDDQWLLNVDEGYTKEVDTVKNEETFPAEPKKKFVFKIKTNTPLPPTPPENTEPAITIENHNLQSPIRSRSTGNQYSSPAAAPIITISEGEASSTTSNDEEFKSPNWRKRLSLQYKQPSPPPPSPPPPTDDKCGPMRANNDNAWKDELPAKQSQSQQFKSQIDPELFKDDMLLFEEDVLDDFEPDVDERPLTPTIYENIASQHKCLLEPATRKENKSIFYNPNVFEPPSPPSIFSKNRHHTKLVPKSASKSDPISNTNSDDELLELLNLTQIEQSAYRKSPKKLPINDDNKATMNNIPKFTFKKSTSESTLKPCSSTSNPPQINDWIDLTRTNKPTNKLPESKKRSQIKHPLLRPSPLPSPAARIPLKVRPSKLQFQDEKTNWSDDDDFIIPGNRSKATKQLSRSLIQSPSPTSFSTMTTNSVTFASSSPLRAIPSSSRNLNQTFCGISPIACTKQRKKRRKIERNPFLHLEAEVSEDDDDDDEDGLDEYDTSFVDSDDEEVLTDSQQVRYLKSVKDIHPNPMLRVETPLEPNNGNGSVLIGDMNYASDSFCVNNDSVEFADVGVFTQAMNVARQEILNENPSSTKRRRTRRQARAHNYERGNSKKISLNKPSTKARRRIIVNEESSDEEEQF